LQIEKFRLDSFRKSWVDTKLGLGLAE